MSDGKLSLHTSLCLDVVTCVIVLYSCMVAHVFFFPFRYGKNAKIHTKQAPVKKWHCMFRTGRVDVFMFFGRSGRIALVD